jgi:hypothetical protein
MSNSSEAKLLKNQTEKDRRDEQVREVLRNSPDPIGPTDIAKKINEHWCVPDGYGLSYAKSAPVILVLRRIGVPSYGGKYWLSEEE